MCIRMKKQINAFISSVKKRAYGLFSVQKSLRGFLLMIIVFMGSVGVVFAQQTNPTLDISIVGRPMKAMYAKSNTTPAEVFRISLFSQGHANGYVNIDSLSLEHVGQRSYFTNYTLNMHSRRTKRGVVKGNMIEFPDLNITLADGRKEDWLLVVSIDGDSPDISDDDFHQFTLVSANDVSIARNSADAETIINGNFPLSSNGLEIRLPSDDPRNNKDGGSGDSSQDDDSNNGGGSGDNSGSGGGTGGGNSGGGTSGGAAVAGGGAAVMGGDGGGNGSGSGGPNPSASQSSSTLTGDLFGADGAERAAQSAYDNVFKQGDLDINTLDTECMLDLLNDRLGINMGTPFSLLGKGADLVGWDGGADVLGGFGQNLADIDINDMGLDDIMNVLNPSNKPVFDGPGLRRGARIIRCNIDRGVSTEKDLNVLIIGWVNFFLILVGVIAVIVIIYAGFLYITTGAEDGAEKAKKIVLYAVLGILLILASYAIVNTIIHEPRVGGGDEISFEDHLT